MRIVMTSLAVLALVACNKAAETGNEAASAAANVAGNATEAAANAVAAVTPAGFQLNETTWTYTYKGQDQTESIDANGHFVAWVKKPAIKYVDQGSAVMKGDKACFTSSMGADKGKEECWTSKPTEIGQSMDTVSDKGQKLTVTRVAYEPAPTIPLPQ
jgi:hypothetical protein